MSQFITKVMSMEKIYLDHAATTPIHSDVLEVMYEASKNVFGNPSSIHAFGREARRLLDEARRTIARSIHADEKEIMFTSGGTESDNLALIGTALANEHKGKHIITTNQEHHATLHAAEYLEEIGFKVTYLPTYEDGKISVKDLEAALTDETILVSVMYVNNETGVIQPIAEIGTLLKDHQAYFHTDAVQALGHFSINVKELGIDLLTMTAHKINGPKGIGALYIAEDVLIKPLLYGGEQERKRRPGTESVIQIIGFQKAVELAMIEQEKRHQQYSAYKQQFLTELEQQGIEFMVNGDPHEQIPSIVNVSFPGTQVEVLLTNFDLEGVAASSGSACTAGSVEPSHVLTAMYGEDERTVNSVRFSFGLANTNENVVEAARRIAKVIKRLK